MAQALYDDQRHAIADICKSLGVSRAALYRYVDSPACPSASGRTASTEAPEPIPSELGS
jgi:hypothetical protein